MRIRARIRKGAVLVLFALLWPLLASAQDMVGLARLDVAQSQVRDEGGGLVVDLWLSQPVPWSVHTLDDPRRLIVDFREVDWRGASREALLNSDRATGLRFGTVRPGWSRLVVDLAEPLILTSAEMRVAEVTGTARVVLRLEPGTAEEFAGRAGAPEGTQWDLDPTPAEAVPEAAEAADGRIVVVIDPGHGGIDPGAERDGVVEAAVMLMLAQELAEAIDRTGTMRAVLTREADVFVPLAERMSRARAAGGDVLISLHADALEEDMARGASVYTLSAEAADRAAARMAERHERGDLLSGLDLTGEEDRVATVLLDLAMLETRPRSLHLAEAMVTGLSDAGTPLNSRPRREAPLAVLNAADFPSVLIEVGFLSSAEDRARLTSAAGREAIVAGILRGLDRWATEEAARARLVRQ